MLEEQHHFYKNCFWITNINCWSFWTWNPGALCTELLENRTSWDNKISEAIIMLGKVLTQKCMDGTLSSVDIWHFHFVKERWPLHIDAVDLRRTSWKINRSSWIYVSLWLGRIRHLVLIQAPNTPASSVILTDLPQSLGGFQLVTTWPAHSATEPLPCCIYILVEYLDHGMNRREVLTVN